MGKEKKDKAPSTMTRRGMRQAIAVKPVSRGEIRYFVDLYYQLQDYRKAGGNQERAAKALNEPPGEFAQSIQGILVSTEKELDKYLDELTQQTALGRWSSSVIGIGPIISAALIAHIDIAEAPTVGRIWRFAGLDPTQHWLGKEKASRRVKEHVDEGTPLDAAIPIMAIEIGCKAATLHRLATSNREGEPVNLTRATLVKACSKRPWNARLKVVCWKIGESFVKTYNNPDSFYGQVYKARKAQEEAKNLRGDFADQAARALVEKSYGHGTDAYKSYIEGRLPPAHIHSRAKRYAVKLFLSAWHEVAWFTTYGSLPAKPWIMGEPGHVHLVNPPNMELVPGLAEAHKAYKPEQRDLRSLAKPLSV